MIATDPRPEWTFGNVELFIYWMKTGDPQPPTATAQEEEEL